MHIIRKYSCYLLLIAMLLSIASCASNPEQATTLETTSKAKDDEIELTLDNYRQFIEVGVETYEGAPGFNVPPSVTCYVKPLTTNYDYNDVKIVLRAKGEYQINRYIFAGYSSPGVPHYDATQFHSFGAYDKTFNIMLSIGGTLIADGNTKMEIVLPEDTTIAAKSMTGEHEIITISGTVSKN